MTNSQPQQGGGSLVSSQPILLTVVTTYQRPLLSSMPSTSNKPVLVAPGLPSVPQKVIDKIKRGEYIDFNELPPARGLSKSLPLHLEGQLVIVQADDLAVSRKLIPNFETWSQCFAIYAAARIASDPSKASDLMTYSHSMASMAKKFPWPSWILYDQAFREEAAYLPARLWGKEDASLYAKCFNWGPTSATPNWCWNCQSLEHQTDQCPHKPSATKRPRRDGLRPRIPARNTITTMVYAVMGLSASLLTNVFLVVIHILTPDVLEKERSKQEIVGANSRRRDACSCIVVQLLINLRRFNSS